jgi:hypothetical protein
MLQRLLNQYEEATNERLKAFSEQNGARTFVKIRLADVFRLDRSGLPANEYRFALQSHFDFVVADADLWPLFAVEYDGRLHRAAAQLARDEVKNALCDRFGLPLLRVNARYLEERANGLDLLGWFVYAWFSCKAVAEAEKSGAIPPGDVFPLDVIMLPGIPGDFPLWLSQPARAEIWKLWKANQEIDPVPSSFVGEGKRGEVRALSWLKVAGQAGVCASTGMRAQQFPVPIDDIVEDLAVLDLKAKLDRVLKGDEHPAPLTEIDAATERFRREVRMMSFSGIDRINITGTATS